MTGDGDRLLVYLTLFVNQCLKRLETAKSKVEGQKVLYQARKHNSRVLFHFQSLATGLGHVPN